MHSMLFSVQFYQFTYILLFFIIALLALLGIIIHKQGSYVCVEVSIH